MTDVDNSIKYTQVQNILLLLLPTMELCMHVYVCGVCVCVFERQRGERENVLNSDVESNTVSPNNS